MQRGCTQAERTILVLTEDYFTSDFTEAEWSAGFAIDPVGDNRLLIPVRVEKFDVPGLLAARSCIELAGLGETAAEKALLEGVKTGRKKPAVKPGFPGGTAGVAAAKPVFPPSVSRIFNVPHPRNPNFTGREGLLKALYKALRSGRPAAVTQAVRGLGGVGKTQLAVEYAYRHARDYAIVWWVRSETSAQLAGDYAALAGELGLLEAGQADEAAIIVAVRKALQGRDDWLLVFDNVHEPEDVADHLPHLAAGHVIITSRHQDWSAMAEELDVPTFPRSESVKFLLHRTGGKDKAAADGIADALGDLPLALEQAAAYIRNTKIGLKDYLDLFKTDRAKLLEKYPPDGYEGTVATTWKMAFERLDPPARALLNLCAFLAPDDIPREILLAGKDDLPDGPAKELAMPIGLNDAVGGLRAYSLIEATPEAISVHRLVQTVVQDGLTAEQRAAFASAGAKTVNRAFPKDLLTNPGSWPVGARLLPHALAAAGHSEVLGVVPDAAGRLLNEAGLYMQIRAQFGEAKEVLKRAVKMDEAAYGPGHPDVATVVNNLGSVLRDMGDLAGAKECFERALKIAEPAYGPDHPTVAICINNLGEVLREMGGLAGAKKCIERALKIDEAAYGPEHPNVARDVNNLGSVLWDMGDLAGAKACFERALKIGEAAYGPDHPKVASAVNNLGGVLQDMGDLAGAKRCYERALKIGEAAYGPLHPDVAIRVNNLGGVLQAMGDLAGARKYGERALAILVKFLGEDHPTTIFVRNNIKSLGGK